MSKLNSAKIQIKNVRLSFPAIFKTAIFEGVDTGKYSAKFLISKDDIDQVKKIKDEIKRLKDLSGLKLSADKICLRDNDLAEETYEGYKNTYTIKASSKLRPTVINRDKTPIVEADGILYPGCYVNAVISFWVQDNKFSKRINCTLWGVQFFRDGEPFGDKTDVGELFEPYDLSSEKQKVKPQDNGDDWL